MATALFLEKKQLPKPWIWTCQPHPREPATPHPERPGKQMVNGTERNLVSPFPPQKQIQKKCKNV